MYYARENQFYEDAYKLKFFLYDTLAKINFCMSYSIDLLNNFNITFLLDKSIIAILYSCLLFQYLFKI